MTPTSEDEIVEMYNPRDEGITALVRKYKSHSYVQKAILNQKTGVYTPKGSDSSIVTDFLGEAGTYALLSAEDEQELFGYIEDGYRLYEQLGGLSKISPDHEQVFVKLVAAQQVVYLTNLRLAFSIAKPYIGRRGEHLEAMDHIQEALIGLSTAINRFDAERGYKFSTYATNWISQNITRSIADKSRVIRMPVHRHEEYLRIKKKVQKYSDSLGRHLSPAEIETASGMTYGEYGDLMRKGATTIPSLDQSVDGDGLELGNIMGYDHLDRAIEEFSDREELASIIKNSDLQEREKLILGLRFGVAPELFGNPSITIGERVISYADLFSNVEIDPDVAHEKPELTLEELGGVLGITRERVRQIQTNALSVLQLTAKDLGMKTRSA